ncbi:xanthine dehydrogenase 1-like [Aricia agestis]|uniref:xanthine dehydrogenase 1-like n=1 Tax=Aricia agestis TaxID=91739 RepID=UPI001C207B47|nr:xanthine dehydrogenase 1-like [Aricia agestis]
MDRIQLRVNGVPCSVGSEVDSTVTLLDYLRKTLGLRGTKYMCREGGCGACVVTITKGRDGKPESVNSCLVSVTSCHNWDVTTVEGIGNKLIGYHPVQTVLAENNGTQCGYCSPGWVMAMYSLLKNKRMTRLEIEQSLGSNVCRCTGYRPILEAFKKFASDSYDSIDIMDIEDLKICKKTGEACSKSNCEEFDWCLINKEDVGNRLINIKLQDGRFWYKIDTINDIFSVFQERGIDSYMLVAGNTGKGVYPIEEYPRILIDIADIPELRGYYFDQNLVIGGGTTLSELAQIFQQLSANDNNFKYLQVLNDHLSLVAHIPVKNIGTIAGNLMLKSQNKTFKSDIFVMLATVGAQITIVTGPGVKKSMSMRSFLKEDMKGKIILNVMLPPLNSYENRVVTFKIMPRSQNAHAMLHSGYLYQLDQQNIVRRCRIIYSGLSENFLRAFKTEKFLIGKPLFTNETLQGALKVLDAEMVVTLKLPEPSVEYRRQEALSLFYKGLLTICPANILRPKYASGAIKVHKARPVSSGRQTFDTDTKDWPVNQAIPKLDGLLQCSGEAKYAEDVPTLQNEVYAAFVLSTVGLGKIARIDPTSALACPGVIAVYTASDIPGVNSFIPKGRILHVDNEEVLCSGDVKYYNQPVAVVVAETQSLAERATKLVSVTYSNVKKPVIDVKDAIKESSRNTQFISMEPTKIGNDVKKVIKGDNTIYGQYHFCMETLVCVSHPTEEGIQVYTATQWVDVVQQMTAKALKMDVNRIDVSCRRVGGAYGYKISRSTQVAIACNLVVYKLNRPCRFIQPLKTNMKAVGKRLPAYLGFEMGVNEKGVIQYAKCEMYSDNGYVRAEDLQPIGLGEYHNCYKKEPWKYTSYNTLTDTPSNTWCRSPITVENIAMCELMMEHIAYEMNLDPVDVRLANLDREQFGELVEMFETLKTNGDYANRKALVDEFNSKNRWKKRGLRFSFIRWTPAAFQYFDVNLNVYHEDGTVVITHGGVEMGQGMNTKAIQICAYYLKIPVDKIQIKANDTTTTPNSFVSGGATASQNVGIGVRRCCEEMLKRLEPIRKEMDNPTWPELVKKAHSMDIDLQAHGFVNIADVQAYHIYGIGLNEVEIDVLTGEYEIIRVDLIEDCGKSINPAIDIGQVEGAYIMGVGYWTSEELIYDKDSGELLSDRSWEYWVPQAKDIPQDFRVYFRKRSYSTELILGAKATGEPATCLGVGIPLALRAAMVAARAESGIPSNVWFNIDGPYTVEKVMCNCGTKKEDFKFY